MKFKHFAQSIFGNFIDRSIERRWFGDRPDPKLEQKLNSILPETIAEDAEFILLNFELLKKLIDADAVPRNYFMKHGRLYKSGDFNQLITPIDDEDQLLVTESLKQRQLSEVMQIVILTESGEHYRSDILFGEEKLVGNISSIQEWIHEHSFYLRRLGHSIVNVSINHVHPSIEVVAVTDEKFTSVTNGLSSSDYAVAERISQHVMYPLTISAILPSGLKYSYTFSTGNSDW